MKTKAIGMGALTLLAAMFGSGCGSTVPTQITQQQALDITSDLFQAMASAPLIPGGVSQFVHAPGVAARIRTATPDGAVSAASIAGAEFARPATAPTTIVIPPYTFNCPTGGTIVVSGSFTGTDNETATPPTINVSENILETINHCGDNGLTINGNPNVAITGNVSLAGNVFTDLTTISGGVTAGNTNCPINVTISVTVDDKAGTESGTISGSVCGVALNSKI
ncbi:MAG TPA: hypothetical protein VGU46_10555 [Acidobacteriaceae bacterium]|nr:hypothetical protein [Acidobacteriaceae bacterium]